MVTNNSDTDQSDTEDVMPKANEIETTPEVDQIDKTKAKTKVLINNKLLVPIFCALLVALYKRDALWRQDHQHLIRSLGQPDKLMNYAEFRLRYPRTTYSRAKLVEESHRSLLFNLDLIAMGRHNLAFMVGKQTYSVTQSPFKADRTNVEQMDVLSQLDEFDLSQLLERQKQRQQEDEEPIDSPVSGHGKKKSASFGIGKKLSSIFTRIVSSDSSFEIPNYPLNEQPDPNKITHIDVDLRDCAGDIRNQGECGACYAFSWLNFVEWHYCKQTGGEKIDLSEQHIVDCGYYANIDGCKAGYILNVMEFTHAFGAHSEQEYPYTGREGYCDGSKKEGNLEIKRFDFTRIKVNRDEWEEVLKEQPILIELYSPDDMMSFRRGIHPGNNCNHKLPHGILLVGYGRQEGHPYWLLKNSLGKKWGENGYFRISRDAPMQDCFRTGFISKFKFKWLDEDKYHDFYETITFQPTVQPEKKKTMRKDMLELFQ